MTLTATTVYLPSVAFDHEAGSAVWNLLTVAAVFIMVNLPCIASRIMFGQQLARILTKPRQLTVFNWTMAGLLIVSMVPVVLSAALSSVL